MHGINILYIVLFCICLFLSAFFAVSEIAFISLQRFKLEHMLQSKVKGARLVAALVEHPERLLSTILLGNNFFNTAAASLGTLLAVAVWGEPGVLIATIGVTALLLVFGDTTPKTIGAHHAARLSVALAPSIRVVSWIFSPFVIVLSWTASMLSRLLGGKPVARSLVSAEEIRAMITAGHKAGIVEEAEADMLHKVFEFGDRPAREIMVPRTEVIWIEKGATIADFLNVYTQHPLNRYPVFQEKRDNVVGILAIKDVLMALAKGTHGKESVTDELIRPACFAPETKRIGEILTEMQANSYHLCVIVDEYGGTAGIVTFTQLVEEIVGRVGDELATIEEEYEIIDEFTFQIEGAMRIEDVNAEMGLGLPEGDYETVAGFVLHRLGHIPRVGEQVKYKGLKIVITQMKGIKIEEILVTREKHAAPAS